jgi:hypothetical protein
MAAKGVDEKAIEPADEPGVFRNSCIVTDHNNCKANFHINGRIRQPTDEWPVDSLTLFAYNLHDVVEMILFPLMFLAPISIFTLGLANTAYFGTVNLFLGIIWLLPLSLLSGLSWIWSKLPWSRPLLVIPGVIIAQLSSIYAACNPEFDDWESWDKKQLICRSWPRSILFLTYKKTLLEATHC